MTQDDVIRMAREAGFEILETGNENVLAVDPDVNAIVRFTALVAAYEREECAKLCEETTEQGGPDMGCETKAYNSAAAIRARGTE